ncbi:MurNAc alpha-1-phosphate uridylyltransferase [Limimonas halophila]|uniref:MurNAc alpha-1-phosphate uridylyltransferase n=1 Tax=Limimonas halophila TaxID=1082479 RepID=A0A1G7U0S8_9PROT|nr:nucleotidyltransferase family protein [Limimonas halophila]SDG41126.1 MurNAc alpha-1-phosphate uridylyltransferase [Limimonas halophila]
MKPTTAMVLAAGHGTRMRPLTADTPKPLLPVLGTPLIDWTLDRLAAAGIERVVVNAHHLADLLEQHVSARTRPAITVVREPELLDTGGALVNARAQFGDEPFYVVNGDVLWLDGVTPALTRLANAWKDSHTDAVLLTAPTARAYGYHGAGDLHLDFVGHVAWRHETEVAPFAYAGVQLLHPRLLDGLAAKPFPITDVLRASDRVYGVPHDGLWFHIGTPDDLKRAEAELIDLGFHAPEAA